MNDTYFFAGFDRRMWIEVSGIPVEPSEVALVHRFGIVRKRAVITAIEKLITESGWQHEFLGDFVHRQTVIRQTQGLVVHVAVRVALAR